MQVYHTVGYLLDKYVPSALVVGQSKSSEKTTIAAHPREYQKLSLWDDFDKFLAPARKLVADSAERPLHHPKSSDVPTEISSESGVASTFEFQIERMVIEICNSITDRQFLFRPASTCRSDGLIRFDPDRVWCVRRLPTDPTHRGSLYTAQCVLEFKTPWALPFVSDAEVTDDLYMKMVKDEDEKPGKYKRAIEQTFGYMSFSNLRYGILSTYDFTFFLRRVPTDGGLQVSRPIQRHEIVGKMVEFFMSIHSHDKEDTSTFHLSPTDYTLLKGDPLNKESGRNKLVKIRTEEYMFAERVVGCTELGSVIQGTVAGVEELVVFKTKDISKSHGELADMQNEADIYEKLSVLQGNVIPYFYGFVDFNGLFYAHVLEDCGNHLTKDALIQNPSLAGKVKAAVEKLHSYGCAHKDLSTQNILVDSHGSVRIIDFGRSIITDDPGDFEADRNDIDKLLETLQRQ